MNKIKLILFNSLYIWIYVILLIVWQNIFLYDFLPKECFSFWFHREWACTRILILLQDYIYIFLWFFIFLINIAIYFFSPHKSKKKNIWYTNFLISFLCFSYISYHGIFEYIIHINSTCQTFIWWLWIDSEFCMGPFVFLRDYKLLIFPLFLSIILSIFHIHDKFIKTYLTK